MTGSQPHYERVGSLVLDTSGRQVFVCSLCSALVAAESKHKHTTWHTGAAHSGDQDTP